MTDQFLLGWEKFRAAVSSFPAGRQWLPLLPLPLPREERTLGRSLKELSPGGPTAQPQWAWPVLGSSVRGQAGRGAQVVPFVQVPRQCLGLRLSGQWPRALQRDSRLVALSEALRKSRSSLSLGFPGGLEAFGKSCLDGTEPSHVYPAVVKAQGQHPVSIEWRPLPCPRVRSSPDKIRSPGPSSSLWFHSLALRGENYYW